MAPLLGALFSLWASLSSATTQPPPRPSLPEQQTQLFSWLRGRGASVHAGLSIRPSPLGGVGVFTSAPLRAGEVIARLPAASDAGVLLTKDALPATDGGSTRFARATDARAFLLLREACRGHESPWWPYLQTLPPRLRATALLPMLWDERTQRRCLGPSTAQRFVQERRKHVRQAWETANVLVSDGCTDSPLGVAMDLDGFRWAVAVLLSRSFRVPLAVGAAEPEAQQQHALVPLGDLFNADLGRGHNVESFSSTDESGSPVFVFRTTRAVAPEAFETDAELTVEYATALSRSRGDTEAGIDVRRVARLLPCTSLLLDYGITCSADAPMRVPEPVVGTVLDPRVHEAMLELRLELGSGSGSGKDKNGDEEEKVAQRLTLLQILGVHPSVEESNAASTPVSSAVLRVPVTGDAMSLPKSALLFAWLARLDPGNVTELLRTAARTDVEGVSGGKDVVREVAAVHATLDSPRVQSFIVTALRAQLRRMQRHQDEKRRGGGAEQAACANGDGDAGACAADASHVVACPAAADPALAAEAAVLLQLSEAVYEPAYTRQFFQILQQQQEIERSRQGPTDEVGRAPGRRA